MNYLLDTNAVIALLTNRPAAVRERLRAALGEGDSAAVSTIVLFELYYGVARSRFRAENSERLRVFLSVKSTSCRLSRPTQRSPAISVRNSKPPVRRSDLTTY